MSKNSQIGKIHHISEVIVNPNTGFQTRELILDCSVTRNGMTSENYPKFTFSGDRMAQLDNFQIGQIVTVDFFLSGRYYQRQDGTVGHYQDIKGLGIQPYQRMAQRPQQAQPMPYTNPANGAQYQTYRPQAPYGQRPQAPQPAQQTGHYPPQQQQPPQGYGQQPNPENPEGDGLPF